MSSPYISLETNYSHIITRIMDLFTALNCQREESVCTSVEFNLVIRVRSFFVDKRLESLTIIVTPLNLNLAANII